MGLAEATCRGVCALIPSLFFSVCLFACLAVIVVVVVVELELK